MNPEEYPSAIADQKRKLVKLERELFAAVQTLKYSEAVIELEVANDSTLKNELQRKATKTLKVQIECAEEANAVQSLKERIELQRIEIELLENLFSLAIAFAKELGCDRK